MTRPDETPRELIVNEETWRALRSGKRDPSTLTGVSIFGIPVRVSCAVAKDEFILVRETNNGLRENDVAEEDFD